MADNTNTKSPVPAQANTGTTTADAQASAGNTRPAPHGGQFESMQPKAPTKKYRLKVGTHSLPDPAYDPIKHGAQMHHKHFTAGEVVDLTEKQFEAFSDKFEGPLPDSAGREVLRTS